MKFKNAKKNPKSGIKKTKSPKNSRIISDQTILLRIYRISLKAFVVGSFILAVVIVGLDLQRNIEDKISNDAQREKMTKELMFWKGFIAKHENYIDAYFQASILEYKLGNTSKAKIYIEKSLALDPNSKDGKKIEEFLNKSSTF